MKRANGTGSVFFRKDKGKYCATVQIYDPSRRQLSRFFDKKKDAVNALAGMREELLTGANIKKQAPTIRVLYEGWSESYATKLSSSKQSAYKTAYKRLKPIENAIISQLDITALQRVLDGLTHYQARDVKNLLSHLYQRAMAQQDATVNLSTFLVLPDLEEKEAEPFNEEEVAKLWSAYNEGDVTAAEILLMIYTGMMPGELCGAKKSQIDWENQRIIGAGLKTKERKERSIMLPDIILPVLRFICDAHNRESLIGKNKWYWYDDYHATVKRLGVRDLPPYAARHTTATALALADAANPLLITRIMRQARPMTTERYKHAEEEQVLAALNRLS